MPWAHTVYVARTGLEHQGCLPQILPAEFVQHWHSAFCETGLTLVRAPEFGPLEPFAFKHKSGTRVVPVLPHGLWHVVHLFEFG